MNGAFKRLSARLFMTGDWLMIVLPLFLAALATILIYLVYQAVMTLRDVALILHLT